MTETAGTDIDADSYALVFSANQNVELITPIDEEGGGLTDGHILLLGLVGLLKQPGWAEQLINQTADQLQQVKSGD